MQSPNYCHLDSSLLSSLATWAWLWVNISSFPPNVILTRAHYRPWLPVCGCQPTSAVPHSYCHLDQSLLSSLNACVCLSANISNPPVTVILTRTYYLPWLLGCGCQPILAILPVTVILTRTYYLPWLLVCARQPTWAILPVTVILTRTYSPPWLLGCGCQPTSAVPYRYSHPDYSLLSCPLPVCGWQPTSVIPTVTVTLTRAYYPLLDCLCVAVSWQQQSPTVTVILTRPYCPPWMPVWLSANTSSPHS